MVAKYTAALPTPSAPLVDPSTGIVSQAWWGWMMSIFARTGGGVGAGPAFPSTTLPLMDATPAVVGVDARYAHGDHVHPTDSGLAAIKANMLAPGVAVTLGASPFTFTAPSHGQILVSGGGVVQLQITANGTTWFNTGSWYGAFPLAKGSKALLTYTGSPSLTFIPT